MQALAEAELLEQGCDLALSLTPAHRLEQLQHGVVDRGHTREQVEVLADEA